MADSATLQGRHSELYLDQTDTREGTREMTERKLRSLKVHLTDDELKSIRLAATANDTTIDEFISEAVLSRAEEALARFTSAARRNSGKSSKRSS